MFIKMQALGILLQYLHSLLKKLGMKCVLGQFQILMSVYVQVIPVFLLLFFLHLTVASLNADIPIMVI